MLAGNAASYGVLGTQGDTDYVIPSVRRGPVYPLFLAAFHWSGEFRERPAALVQILGDALVASLIVLATRRVDRYSVGLIPGALYALHPGAVKASTMLLSESVYTTLFVAGFLLLAQAAVSGRVPIAAVAGAVIGLAALCRPIALPFPFLFAALLLLRPVRVAGRRAPLTAAMIAAFLVAVTPWIVRSSLLAGQFVPIQAAGPVNLYVASRLDWDQFDETSFWKSFASDPYGSRLYGAMTPAEMVAADKVGRQLALDNISANPWGYVRGRLRGFSHFVVTSFDSVTGLHVPFSRALREGAYLTLAVKLSLLLGFSVAPLALGSLGLLTAWREPGVLLAGGTWLGTALLMAPTWVEARYWVPAMPLLLITAGAGLTGLATRCGERVARS